MTLKEKFKKEGFSNCSYLEKVADNYAINFGKFIEKMKDADIDSLDYHFYLNNNMEQLLEIFKKEIVNI